MLRALCGEIVVPQAGRSPQNLFAFAQLCYFAPPQQARSSVVEHHLDMVVVGGSIPLAPTRMFETQINADDENMMNADRAGIKTTNSSFIRVYL